MGDHVNHLLERLAQALETSGVDVVPRVQINTGGDAGAGPGGGALQALIGMLLSEKGMSLLATPAANDRGPVALPDEDAEVAAE